MAVCNRQMRMGRLQCCAQPATPDVVGKATVPKTTVSPFVFPQMLNTQTHHVNIAALKFSLFDKD